MLEKITIVNIIYPVLSVKLTYLFGSKTKSVKRHVLAIYADTMLIEKILFLNVSFIINACVVVNRTVFSNRTIRIIALNGLNVYFFFFNLTVLSWVFLCFKLKYI